MGLFDDNFYDQKDKNYVNKGIQLENDEEYIAFNLEDDEDEYLEFDDEDDSDVNQSNENEFFELMESARVSTDDYWDINDPLVRIILGILFAISFIGSVYYIGMWLLSF